MKDAGIFKWDRVSRCYHPQYEKYALNADGQLLPGFVRLYRLNDLLENVESVLIAVGIDSPDRRHILDRLA